MSGKVVGWAFDAARAGKKKLNATERYVLVAYADNADQDGKCWPEKAAIVKKTGLSRATVYRAIAKLEKGKLIEFTEDDRGRECVYLGVSHSETGVPDESHCETGHSQSEKSTNNSEPSRTVKGRKRKKKDDRHRVNKQLVTDQEFELATEVLERFNAAASTQLSVVPHLVPLVGRIREKPAMTAEHHGMVIAAVFAGEHWWSDPPGIEIIYGNASQFEKSLEIGRAAIRAQASVVDVNAAGDQIRREQGLEP